MQGYYGENRFWAHKPVTRHKRKIFLLTSAELAWSQMIK
jgi:hypothetical protein